MSIKRTFLVLPLELLHEVVGDAGVQVITSKMGIVFTSEISSSIVRREAFSIKIETIGDGSSSGFVDDTEDVQTRNGSSVLGGLTLRVIEVGRYRHNSVGDGGSEVRLGSLLHLLQDETTDLRRRVLLTPRLDPSITVGVLDDLVGNLLNIALNLGILELASD